ncbi:MAG: methionine ABC transporter permease, partial [Klebsiella pneumoniae]|nr:methionine ABC transporter permease [Klebsiella pneumoniae]
MTSLLAFFAEIDWNDVAQAALDTLTMLAWSLGWTVLLGLPLGIVLYLTGEPRLLYAPRLYRLLSLCVNVLRSLPFIILLIVMIPVTTLLTGTSLGVEGTIPPLVAGCAPFFARLVETALREVEHGLVEASWSMGGSTWQLIWHTLLPESRAGLIAAVTVTAILLVDYTSMAGVIGGGGLGDLAIRF